jgi:hypothetical protein
MNKYKETYGVDISKDVFDVQGTESGHSQYKKDLSGFKKFLTDLPDDLLAPPLLSIKATKQYLFVPLNTKPCANLPPG